MFFEVFKSRSVNLEFFLNWPYLKPYNVRLNSKAYINIPDNCGTGKLEHEKYKIFLNKQRQQGIDYH